MRKTMVVALVAGAVALVGMSAGGASRQVTSSTRPDITTSSVEPTSAAPNAAALAERAALLNEQAAVHHAKVVDLRNRIEANARAYEQRVQRELGDRAPKETISPMATISPIETASPAGN